MDQETRNELHRYRVIHKSISEFEVVDECEWPIKDRVAVARNTCAALLNVKPEQITGIRFLDRWTARVSVSVPKDGAAGSLSATPEAK